MGQPDTTDATATVRRGQVRPRRPRASVDRPTMALLGMIHGYWNTQVVRAMADLRLADHLAAGPLTADEVAAIESSDPAATYRLMRACVGLGLLGYEDDGRFSVAPAGALLGSGVPGLALRDHALAFKVPPGGTGCPGDSCPRPPQGQPGGSCGARRGSVEQVGAEHRGRLAAALGAAARSQSARAAARRPRCSAPTCSTTSPGRRRSRLSSPPRWRRSPGRSRPMPPGSSTRPACRSRSTWAAAPGS